jgi:hypothetical protein
VLGRLVVCKGDGSWKKVDGWVGEDVVEVSNRKVFEFLLDIPRWEAGHEAQDVFEEEQAVVNAIRFCVRKRVEDGWDSIEGQWCPTLEL